jgi:hypothetical protein
MTYVFLPWKPDEKEIAVLLPLVDTREKAIECLRALAKHHRHEIREQEENIGGYVYESSGGEGEML